MNWAVRGEVPRAESQAVQEAVLRSEKWSVLPLQVVPGAVPSIVRWSVNLLVAGAEWGIVLGMQPLAAVKSLTQAMLVAAVNVVVIAAVGSRQMVDRTVGMPAGFTLSLVGIQAGPLGSQAGVGKSSTLAAHIVSSVFPVKGMRGCVSGPTRHF